MRSSHPILTGAAAGAACGVVVGVAEASVIWSSQSWVGRGVFGWAILIDTALGLMLGTLVALALRGRVRGLSRPAIDLLGAGLIACVLGASALLFAPGAEDTMIIEARQPDTNDPRPDVYWVLLDGVRARDVQPDLMPVLHGLAQRSLRYDLSYAAAPARQEALVALRETLGENPFEHAHRDGYATLARLPWPPFSAEDLTLPDLPDGPAGWPPSVHLLPVSGQIARLLTTDGRQGSDARRVREVSDFLQRYPQPRFVSLILDDAATQGVGIERTDRALGALLGAIEAHARPEGYRLVIQGLRGRPDSAHPLAAAQLAVPALAYEAPDSPSLHLAERPTADQVLSLLGAVVPAVANHPTFPDPFMTARFEAAQRAAILETIAQHPILRARWDSRPPEDALALAYVETLPFQYADQRPCGWRYRSAPPVQHTVQVAGVVHEAIRHEGYTLLRSTSDDGVVIEQLFDHNADPDELLDLLQAPGSSTCDGVPAEVRAARMRRTLSSDG